MQELFVLRHGQAEDLNTNHPKNDFDRHLTEDGKEKIQKLGLFLDKLAEDIDLILSSPLIRAKETAETILSNLSMKPELKIVDFLSAGASSKDISKGLLQFSSTNNILLVGHAPDLEMFIGKLVGAERIKLKKGALAKISLSSSIELSGGLEWLLTPKIVKKFKTKKKPKLDKIDKLEKV